MGQTLNRVRGFTLIELMVTVAVLGILAAIAFPSYQEYLRKGRRVDAKTSLMNAAQAMERYYTENNKYTDAAVGTVFPAASLEGDYTLSFATGSPTANAYTIQAAPSSSRQSADKCGTFTISNTGQKGVTGGTLNSSACW